MSNVHNALSCNFAVSMILDMINLKTCKNLPPVKIFLSTYDFTNALYIFSRHGQYAYTQKLVFVPSPQPRFPSIGNLGWGFGN